MPTYVVHVSMYSHAPVSKYKHETNRDDAILISRCFLHNHSHVRNDLSTSITIHTNNHTHVQVRNYCTLHGASYCHWQTDVTWE